MNLIENIAAKVLRENKVAIYIVAYNAESLINKTLSRIPKFVAESVTEIFVIDDSSTDKTLENVKKIEWPENFAPLKIYRTPRNQGYGGNQRLGYLYSIAKDFDIVVSLHADGQYAPEALPVVLAPYDEGFDAVFGSRFMNKLGPLQGGMPLYKFVGNKVLTKIQNWFLGTNLSEMHSGYKTYRVSALRKIPFEFNSRSFDFDADIITQLVAANLKIKEVPIPTFYGDEICRVNGMKYAWECVKTALKFRLMQNEVYYDPKFDLNRVDKTPYRVTNSRSGLMTFVQNATIPANSKVLDLTLAGSLTALSVDKSNDVTYVSQRTDPLSQDEFEINADLNGPWEKYIGDADNFDTVFALDILERMNFPERGVREIFKRMKVGGQLYVNCGNVAYLPLRLLLLLGVFNYGRKGVLEFTHARLFTIDSLKRLLGNQGFRVEQVVGFPSPLFDEGRRLKSSFFTRIFSWLARKWPTLFASEILIKATRDDSPRELLSQTLQEDVWDKILEKKLRVAENHPAGDLSL